MPRFSNFRRMTLLGMPSALAFAAAMLVANGAAAAPPRIDESQLLEVGFKVLGATTTVQQEWVKGLAPGQVRAMQRNGRKFFIYPDAPRSQIYVGGPAEYAAFLQRHPENRVDAQDAANKANAYRGKQDDAMRQATSRDLSDPFLGVSWADLGW